MFVLILSFITAFIITFVAVPAIITVATSRKLYDLPNTRSSHEQPTPSLGGIAMFGGAIVSIILWTPTDYFGQLQYILGAIILLFLVGSRDDLVPIPPVKKLMIQLLAAVILEEKAKVSLNDWWGIFGIHQLDRPAEFIFSVVAIVGIINAYNLIDGINGLAGGVALMGTLFFGSWFFLAGHLEWAVVAVALAGAIVAFLHYNATPAKIFMGDTGSMLIGVLCAVMALEFISLNKSVEGINPWFIPNAPIVALAVLLFPIYDTLRVFALRIAQGKSPFKADKNHIHHLLLKGGKSHIQATLIILFFNLLLITFTLLIKDLNLNLELLMLTTTALALNATMATWLKQKNQNIYQENLN
jgi:UDP-N-acetylmuramyl pentapeptide phosphotransferase/UDP-N-acetylglucosamine-1-phosphate transferase